MDDFCGLALQAARQGGAAVMAVYRTDLQVDLKSDGSPLTQADRASHETICAVLSSSGLPVVSEESGGLMMDASRYWLVDPLDGTKDFLAANDEFTVNVALIDAGYPTIGVVHVPAFDEVFVGQRGKAGAWRDASGRRDLLKALPASVGMRMATSRFHDTPQNEGFARRNAVTEKVPVGSALKFCRLAEGRVDVYPRLVGTSEWDTAAGQAVLEASGGALIDLVTGERMRYGKPNRRNGRFLAFRTPYRYRDFKEDLA